MIIQRLKKKNQQTYKNNDLKNYSRFWDGGVLSNTPLRELIQSHQDYWKLVENIADSKMSIPDLEVYIVDVWPSVRIIQFLQIWMV